MRADVAMLSIHCKRLENFEELASDPDYGAKRAIDRLKAWKFSQKHRLSDLDNKYIDAAIKRYSKTSSSKKKDK